MYESATRVTRTECAGAADHREQRRGDASAGSLAPGRTPSVTVDGRCTPAERPQASDDFDAFYLTEWDRLVRRAGLVVRSVPLAEDVVQEVMAEVYRRWDSIADPRAYAFRASVNGAVRAARRAARDHRERDVQEPDRHVAAMQDESATEEELAHLADALVVLSPKQRAMVVLKFYDGYLEREIAQIMGCRPGSVGPTITRALRRLRTEVQR